MTDVELSATTYSIFCALVEDRIGVHHRAEDKAIFASKLGERLAATGFTTPLDYYYSLRYDDPDRTEWSRFAEALLVGETYFFRELYALEAAMEVVVAPAAARTGRGAEPVRVLSAGCSTGEEPLSVAMLVGARGLADAVEIVAVDVNARAIERARAGVFRERSMRAMPAAHVASFAPLASGPTGAVRIDPTLVDAVTWRCGNLLDGVFMTSLGAFDLVLCRNVLIYFRDDVVAEVARSLARALRPATESGRPSGRLLVGASESLMRYGTELRCEERRGTFFYGRGA